MSKAYDLRVAIKDSIAGAGFGLTYDDIVIERQADILAAIDASISQSENGVALLLSAVRGKRLDEDGPLEFTTTLTASLWVRPIYDLEAMPEEDLAECLIRHLDELLLEGAQHCMNRLIVTGWADVPDEDFLIRAITLQTRISYEE